jgi:hypothetical protein
MNRTQFLRRPCVDSVLSSPIQPVCAHCCSDCPQGKREFSDPRSFLPSESVGG